MKKLFKYCSFVILTILFFSLYNNIEANDIKIHATKAGQGVDFQTEIGAHSKTVKNWNDNHQSTNGDTLYAYETNKYTNVKNYLQYKYVKPYGDDITNGFSDGTVRSYSYLIHNKKLSNYIKGNTYGYVNDYKTARRIKTEIKAINVDSVNTIEMPKLSYGYSIKEQGSSDIYIQYSHFPKEYVKFISDNLYKYSAGKDGEGTYFYISEPIAFKYSNFETRSAVRDVYDNGKYFKRTVGLLRASDVASYEGIYGDPRNKNMPQDFGLDGNKFSASTSFINYYDNKLYLPQSLFTNHKVYVRHVDANSGKSVGKNENEILQSGRTKSIKNNVGIPKGDKASASGFSEYYEINSGETLYVSRLLNLIQNGSYYKVDSVTTSTANTYDDALKNEKNAKANKNDSVSVTAGDNSQVTVITFKYSKVPTNPDPNDDDNKPKGGVDTVNADGISDNCQMSYTPTNEKIKPYLVANKVKFLNLKYEYVIEDNEIKYKSKIFNVEKLVSGNISDNDNDNGKYSNNVGKIFGTENDNETLLIGKSSQTFAISNDIDGKLNNLKKVGSLPSADTLKNIAKEKTEKKDSLTEGYTVPENRYNGLRIPKLTANYQEYDVLNNNTGKTESIGVNNIIKVLVYNPIKVGDISVESEGVVDHSTKKETDYSVIQKNANFKLSIRDVSGEPYTGHTYNEYLDKYYLIFDISIIKTDKTDYSGLYQVVGDELKPMNVGVSGEIPRGTIIELNKEQKAFYAKAGQTSTSDTISQNSSQITLIGSSNNMPSNWLKSYVLRHEKYSLIDSLTEKNYISSLGSNERYEINGISTSVKKDYCNEEDYTKYKVHDSNAYNGKDMFGDAYYFAKNTTSITNIGRIYDFKVTDCSDIDYKKVFRKTIGNNVNSLTGVEYFSGIKKFSIFSSDVNTLEDRENLKSVYSSSKTILPLGPYKNTDTSYVNAPKMGYRISFDLKTSGYYNYTESNAKNSKRVIKITPSYYYISKDGQTYKSNIDLYYKNSEGKYVKFVGSDYTIYFKPKDGYRTKTNSTTTPDNEFMSEQLEPLKIGSSEGFTLDYKMMNTSNDNFIQSWYGEFKLPNSTIVTENGNVSKPLTDGYVGVKFNIECIDTDSSSKVKTISYNTNNKNASPNTNTSQWDYEGYLGFSNPGSAAGDIALQLEKGTWTVNDNNSGPKAKYTDIKGTVALFDLDNRAANDFD